MYITKFETLDEWLRDALNADIRVHAPGIHVLFVRVTKPRIPEAILRNYDLMESERTRLQIVERTQKIVEKEADTARLRQIIAAETIASSRRSSCVASWRPSARGRRRRSSTPL